MSRSDKTAKVKAKDERRGVLPQAEHSISSPSSVAVRKKVAHPFKLEYRSPQMNVWRLWNRYVDREAAQRVQEKLARSLSRWEWRIVEEPI